jgi:sugar transferase (PEP-CTERM/EpsH1 system associated)
VKIHNRFINGPSLAKRKIRLMHVIRALSVAGLEYGVIKLLNRLDRSLFEPMICCKGRSFNEARSLLSPDVRVIELNTEKDGLNYNIINKLVRVFRESAVDIVHSHNWSTFVYVVPAARIAGVPVVIHGEHGRDKENPDTGMIKNLMWRILEPMTDEFVGVSENIVEELSLFRHIPTWKIHFIPNGVDTDRFRPDLPREEIRERFGIGPSCRVIGCIGGFRKIKGHEILLEALKLVKLKIPRVRLFLIGGNPKELATDPRIKELQTLSSKLGLSENVFFMGPRMDIPEWMSAFDVFVNCSFYEGMSNTILEAMASGRPVVATRVGGAIQILKDKESGLLIPPKDSMALAGAICNFLENLDLGTRLGGAAREWVLEHHSLVRMVEMNESIYLDAITRKKLKSPLTRRQHIRQAGGYGLGVIGGLRVGRWLVPNDLTILTYHRILPSHLKASVFNLPMIVDKQVFERQMATLASEYSPVSLAQAISGLRGEKALPDRAVLVTFDDGYRDNYLYAYPILKKYGIPATIFVATQHIDTGLPFWWDWFSEGFLKLARFGGKEDLDQILEKVSSAQATNIPVPSDGFNAFRTFTDALVRRVRNLPLQPRQNVFGLLQEMLQRLDISLGEERIILSWEEIREMQANGIEIGSHSDSHIFMDESDPNIIMQNLKTSYERIREMTGRQPTAISYPGGRIAPGQEELVREIGFLAGAMVQPGPNRIGCDLYLLKRLDGGYLTPNAGFSRSLMNIELMNILRH